MKTSSPPWSMSANGRHYWHSQGLRFDRSFFGAPTTQLYLAEEQRLFQRYLAPLQGKRILKLDLWNEAQNTEVLFWAAAQGADCCGVDIAESTVRKAQTRGRNLEHSISVTVGDILSLPFQSGSFDCVYSMGTIEHLPDPAAAVAELARVLRRGGLAIVGVPNKIDPFLFPLGSAALQAVGLYPYGYERPYTNGDLRSLLEAHGLRSLHRDGILFLPWFLRMVDLVLWLKWPPASGVTGLLTQPFRLLCRIRPLVQRFGYLTVCVAEK